VIHWVTTNPNPRVRATGYDAGQRGWRLHALEAEEKATFSGVGKQRSLCGLRPRHGWSLDLFIEEKCARCAKKLGLVRDEFTGEWIPERKADEQEQEHNQHVQII
jgi:hypothetical protein